jgi:fucose permease
MNWLHACWGLGASIGPLIMGQYLAANASWRLGYATIAAIQGVLALVLLGTIGMWRVAVPHGQGDRSEQAAHSSLLRTLGLPRAKAAVVVFVAYCALEGSTMLWSSTFLVHVRGFPAGLAATFGALYVFGITAGRIISGFLALRIRPHRLVWLGIGSVLVGLAVLLLGWTATAAVGLILMGLGSGPIYPNMIHETPRLFGAESSQAMIGLEMAGANLGILVFPALFGGIAALFGYVILPIYLIVIVAILALALWWLHILPESAVQRPQS